MQGISRWFCYMSSVLVCWGVATVANADTKDVIPVKVGAYEYGVVYFFENDKPSGFIPELIAHLNAIQSKYFFELVETSSRRRYNDLAIGDFDLILMESPDWDWRDQDVLFSDPIVVEYDLFIARKEDVPGPSWFDDITRHELLCVLGFHYKFASFNANPEYLQDHFGVLFHYDEQQLFDHLLDGEGDVGIVSAGFLARAYAKNPKLSQRVFIGPSPDFSYELVAVLAKQSAISLAEFNDLIRILKREGNIAQEWRDMHGNLPAG